MQQQETPQLQPSSWATSTATANSSDNISINNSLQQQQPTLHQRPAISLKQTTDLDGTPLTICDVDVYCGRDKRTHSHPGNKRFRELIASYREQYQQASLREQKTRITTEIINQVHSYGGRFMKLRDEGSSLQEWYEVDAANTHDKVSHALRSAKDPTRPRQAKERKVKIEKPTPMEEEIFQRVLTKQKHYYRELEVKYANVSTSSSAAPHLSLGK